MGLAVVEFDGTTPTPVDAWVIATHKGRSGADRVTEDDARRMQMLWFAIDSAIAEHHPDVIGVEAYTVYKPTQGGHAGKGAGWKAIYAYAMACSAAFAHGLEVRVYLPSDLKRRVGRATDASKGAVQQALVASMPAAAAVFERTAATNREHAADAMGHALMTVVDHWHAASIATPSDNGPSSIPNPV